MKIRKKLEMYAGFAVASISKVRKYLYFFSFCTILLTVGFFAVKKVVKEAVISALSGENLEALGIQRLGYSNVDVSFFPVLHVDIHGLVLDGLYLRANVNVLRLSHNIFGKVTSVEIPDGYLYFSADEDSIGKSIRCSVKPKISVEHRDSMFLSLMRRILFGKKAGQNVVSKFAYIDDAIASCVKNSGDDGVEGTYVYEEAKFLLSFSGNSSVKVDSFIRLKGKGSLLFDVNDVLIQKDEGDAAIDISSVVFSGEGFKAKLYGNALISQKCALMSFRRCKYDINLEVKGFGKLSEFFYDKMRQFGGDEGGTHMMGMVGTLLSTLKSAAAYDEKEDVYRLYIKSTGRGGDLRIGTMTFNKMSNMLVEKFRRTYLED